MNTCAQKPLNNSVSEKPTITELALIEASTAIGSIAESNAQFTSGLADYLDSLDKHLSEITVLELIDLLNKYRDDFNGRTDSKLKEVKSFYLEKVSDEPTPPAPPKTSRFNVLDKAKQYQDCVVKFSGMAVAI